MMNTTVRKEPNKILPLLFVVVLSRLVFALVIFKLNGWNGFFSPDTGNYAECARAMLQGSFSYFGVTELFRTPGYPLLLLPGVAIQHLALVALMENLFLAAISAWLIWLIATELFPATKAGFWAVLLYCCEPIGFIFSLRFLTETPFTTALLLFVWTFLRFLRTPTYGKLLLSAFVLGCTTYIRPVTLYLSFLLALFLVLFPKGLRLQQRLAHAAVFPVLLVLTLSPWMVRNAMVADYKGFSSAGDVNLYFMSAAAVQAKLDHKSFAQQLDDWGYANTNRYYQLHPNQRTWTQGQLARFWNAEAKSILSHHSALYLGIHARGSATVMFEPGATEILRSLHLYPEFGGLLSRSLDQGFFRATLWLLREYPATAVLLPLLSIQLLLYYLLALAGLRHLPVDVRSFVIVLIAYFILVSGVPGAVARYRVPIMPLVCICAGAAIVHWRTKTDSQHESHPSPSAAEPR